MAKKEIKFEVVLLLHEEKKTEKNKVCLQIIKWNDGEPRLEKRPSYLAEDEDGEPIWKYRKAMGLNSKDISIIKDNYDNIMGVLNGKR